MRTKQPWRGKSGKFQERTTEGRSKHVKRKKRKDSRVRRTDGAGRTTVAHGYYELHNTWSSHNGAAPGCGRAGGMSFSPFAVEKTILVSILSPHDTALPSLSGPRPFLRLGTVSSMNSLSLSLCRYHKVIILRSLQEAESIWNSFRDGRARETEINLLPTPRLDESQEFPERELFQVLAASNWSIPDDLAGWVNGETR